MIVLDVIEDRAVTSFVETNLRVQECYAPHTINLAVIDDVGVIVEIVWTIGTSAPYIHSTTTEHFYMLDAFYFLRALYVRPETKLSGERPLWRTHASYLSMV